MTEDLLTVEIIPKTFPTVQAALEYMSLDMKDKLQKGFIEIDGSNITSTMNLGQEKKKKKDQIKSIPELTDEVQKRTKKVVTGEEVDLGEPGDQPIKVLLAELWTEAVNPKGWMLSEKLDGMRMIWTGEQMFTRNGNLIYFPQFFVRGWPNSYLDGELWLERDSFQKLLSITKKQVPDPDQWKDVKFMVFDAPKLNAPFSIRYERFKEAIEQSKNTNLLHVPHIVCEGKEHLMQELDKIQNSGGEGLMLRDPKSHYEGRRSKTLLKVKSYHDDDAKVIGYEAGGGRCEGMVGALRVINKQGYTFGVGSGMSNALRQNPPPIGSMITYKYYGSTRDGLPRFPIFLRVKPEE